MIIMIKIYFNWTKAKPLFFFISHSIIWESFSKEDLRTVPTNSKVFLRGLPNLREKQILTSVIEIQKENWG